MEHKRIAIVGGGVSGIGCLWGLRDTNYEIHLYEADSRLGGHANTVTYNGNGNSSSVDTGFIAMNEKTYPNFTSFLKALGVATVSTDMSFAVSQNHGAFEWGSTSFSAFVGPVWNIFSLWFWRLLLDILRFNCFATDILSQAHSYSDSSFPNDQNDDKPTKGLESIGEYLDREGYSEQFKNCYIIPMVAAPWCIDPNEFSENFPAITLIRFMWNHRLLDTVSRRLHWRTIKNGSKAYIDAFLTTLQPRHHVHLSTPVESLVRQDCNRISLMTATELTATFDHVILAVHAGQALSMLGQNATTMEKDILRHFKTSRNVCYLHSDMSLLPQRPAARASWNCLMQGSTTTLPDDSKRRFKQSGVPQKISVTFDMNRLQGIPSPGHPQSPGRVLVSMNPIHTPLGVQGVYVYHHPLFSSASVCAARRLPQINGVNGISFAGAWIGHGFHEDGFTTGLEAARTLTRNTTTEMKFFDGTTLREFPESDLRSRVYRAAIGIVQSIIDIVCDRQGVRC